MLGHGTGVMTGVCYVQMQPGCSVSQAAGAVLQLEAALRRIALDPQWDPAITPGGTGSPPRATPDGNFDPAPQGESWHCEQWNKLASGGHVNVSYT